MLKVSLFRNNCNGNEVKWRIIRAKVQWPPILTIKVDSPHSIEIDRKTEQRSNIRGEKVGHA